jgi:hypothetical protein
VPVALHLATNRTGATQSSFHTFSEQIVPLSTCDNPCRLQQGSTPVPRAYVFVAIRNEIQEPHNASLQIVLGSDVLLELKNITAPREGSDLIMIELWIAFEGKNAAMMKVANGTQVAFSGFVRLADPAVFREDRAMQLKQCSNTGAIDPFSAGEFRFYYT